MLRALVIGALLCGAALGWASTSAPPSPAEFADLDDDPKCARGECRPPRPRPIDEDDPKLARGLARRWPRPRIEVGYRFLQVTDPYGGTLPMHLVEASGFPISDIFRLGISLSAGGAPRYSGWMFDVGLSVGVQYPFRVTPFLDLRFNVGVIGADIVDHKVVSYQYRPTIEGGVSIFLSGRVHLTAALGWAHTIYGGVDANVAQMMINAGQSPKFDVQDLHLDTVTARVGLGF